MDQSLRQNFIVERDNLANSRVVDAARQTPAPGQVLLKVDRFALTANNITYGVAGDMIGYWQFFPAPDGWGRIPVWGIGTVAESAHDEVEIGTRFYGYFPMSSELLVEPSRVTPRGFVDASAHRAELPGAYNHYSNMAEENGFDPAFDNHAMIYRPLFTTSFVLDDFLADNGSFGARTIVLGSASSKTAFGLAFMLQRRGGSKVVGLTSKGNVEFVESLNLYDLVLSYDDVQQLPQEPSVYVDMAGNPTVLSEVHHHLKDDLTYSCGVGITHWETRGDARPADLPGATPAMFFAPSQIEKRSQELGAQQYQAQIGEATQAFFGAVDEWVQIEELEFEALQGVYTNMLSSIAPNKGIVFKT